MCLPICLPNIPPATMTKRVTKSIGYLRAQSSVLARQISARILKLMGEDPQLVPTGVIKWVAVVELYSACSAVPFYINFHQPSCSCICPSTTISRYCSFTSVPCNYYVASMFVRDGEKDPHYAIRQNICVWFLFLIVGCALTKGQIINVCAFNNKFLLLIIHDQLGSSCIFGENAK